MVRKNGAISKQAIDNQETDDGGLYPPRFNQTFLRWMENVHDWVISRQLWWGHQIPAWYHKETGEMYVGLEAPAECRKLATRSRRIGYLV